VCVSVQTQQLAMPAVNDYFIPSDRMQGGTDSANVRRCHTFQFGVKALTESCTLSAVVAPSRIGEEGSLTKYPDFVGDGPETSDGNTCCTL
jgi:hypothetical protein